MIQVAAVTGVWGLSLITVVAAAMPAALAEPGRAGRIAVATAAAVLATAWAGGEVRLAGADAGIVPGVRLRLVQADIPQGQKWVPGLRRAHLVRQVELSIRPPAAGAAAPTHVIWGETMVPLFLAQSEAALALVAAAAPPGGVLIAGAPRSEAVADPTARVWNSLHAVDRQGRIVATYDKAHLVPFGEYMPFRALLPGVAKITHGETDFSRGRGRVTLRLPGLPPVSPLMAPAARKYEADDASPSTKISPGLT